MREALRIVAAMMLLLVPLAAPAAAQSDRFVPESLWGVKSDIGLGFVRETLTNYGNRSFWEARPSGEGVQVAIIDTGLSPSHPDLDGTLACGHCWKDFVNQRPRPYDDNGHGTHVAGIVAGNGHLQPNPLNAYFPTGARGIAPGAQLIVAKAMNATGGGSDTRVANAIEWVMDPDGQPGTGDEPDILHLSLGVRAPTTTDGTVKVGSRTEEVVRDAIERGILVVMSAGNQGEQGPAPPGNVDGVLAVGALDADGQLVAFSNRGKGVDVFAPGVIMSTWPRQLDGDGITDAYTGLAGTSQAAPVVTGALALVLDANPRLAEGGPTMVQHIESTVRSTSAREDAGGMQVRTLDAGALLAAEDAGTDEISVGVVTVLGVAGLLVVVLGGRAAWRALEAYVERNPEPNPPANESAPAGGGEAPETEARPDEEDPADEPQDVRFEQG